MFLQEAHLQLVPFVLIIDNTIHHQFIKQFIANGKEIVAAQVIKVGIANYLFKFIMWCLGYLSSHDHTTDTVDLFIGIAKIGQVLLGYLA